MSLLGNVLGGLFGGAGGSPMQGVIMNLLGDQQAQGESFGGIGGSQNGLAGLVSAFSRAGLGDVVQSWIGGGQNQPVSPDQLRNVFGEQRVQSMAQQAGMEQGDFLSQLSQHLPRAVDGVTPNGRLPDEGTVSV